MSGKKNQMISFDQYQRYATFGKMIESMQREFSPSAAFRILEVGANAQRNLEKFVDADIYYTDIVEIDGFEDDDHFFVADATDLKGIEDDAYDIVVASDVFEHIPAVLRECFLNEISRVSKYVALICFPQGKDYVERAEKRLNQYYKSIYGEDYIWLKEHLENELPDLGVVNATLRKNHLFKASCEHGSIRMWEAMFKLHFFTVHNQDMIEYRQYIDEEYNANAYACDISGENYRVFYAITKMESDIPYYENLMKGLFVSDESRLLEEYVKIRDLCQEVKDIMYVQISESQGQITPSVCYVNTGNGYSEKEKIICSKIMDGKHNIIEVNIAEIDGIKSLRYDMIEGCKSIVYNLQIQDETGRMLPYTTNGIYRESAILFDTTDPQIEIEIFASVKSVILQFQSMFIRNDIQWELFQQAEMFMEKEEELGELKAGKRELEEKLGELKAGKRELEIELNNLRVKKASLEMQYHAIASSFFWRFTKPLRILCSVLKRIALIRYTGKFFLSLKRNGLRTTLHLVKDKLNKTEQRKKDSVDYELAIDDVEEMILFSIVVPLYNTDVQCLKELIESVLQQTYSNWELVLGDASDKNAVEICKICQTYADKHSRIKYVFLKENKGISENTNQCVAQASGEYIVLCDHDDILARDALKVNAWMIQNTEAEVLYSDEAHLDMQGNVVAPLFKPDWSIDLLHSQMYTCHLFVFKKSLFNEAGRFRPEFDGSQDYDLMLRFSETTEKICHIPMILYYWREIETSTAANAEAKPYADESGRRALEEHLRRKYGECAHACSTDNPFVYDTQFKMPDNSPMVSIIIPMKDQHEMTNQCVESILTKSSYHNYEIIILNNRSEKAKTYRWFAHIKQKDQRVRIYDADFDFNWSKLNNFGMCYAKGEMYIFLNNDTKVISEDWIERLSSNALREDVGVVGPLLLYEDETIQHAGIVVGMGGWADHVFKGMPAQHNGTPFISPMVNRNVSAVTGACMAISKRTIEEIGMFDERFIICGSDVEICLRAYDSGRNNLYLADTRLYHLESKSRDSYIPDIDFQLSYECYKNCREFGDPYYNVNLDINSYIPKENVENMDFAKIKEHLKNNRFTAKTYEKVRNKIMIPSADSVATIPEVQEIGGREIHEKQEKIRLNILVPSVDVSHVFGGIATALKFYEKICDINNLARRIIVTDAPVKEDTMISMEGYRILAPEEDSLEDYQIVPFSDRCGKTVPVYENDVFMATGWWTAYTIADVIRWQSEVYSQEIKPLVYMVQDYEPGFYPWSSRYLMADSTYKMEIPTIAILNSAQLNEYFEKNNYVFAHKFYFEPSLNEELRKYLAAGADTVNRKKRILVYARPGIERNAFALLVAALRKWAEIQEDARDWTILGAGESFEDVDLGNGNILKSIGKVSLKEYAEIMLETKAGISLMVSPHPSYPPLEMAAFGVKVITNTYANKDLSSFSNNIISVSNCSALNIARELCQACGGSDGRILLDSAYVAGKNEETWSVIAGEIGRILE